MISAQRFKVLDKETNVGVANFTSGLDSSILNSAQNALQAVSPSLDSLIESSIQKGLQELEQTKDAFKVDDILSGVTRAAKDIGGRVSDLLSLPESKLNELMSDIADGNPQITKSLMGIMKSCSARGMGQGLPGKPYDPSINCGAGKIGVGTSGSAASCNASSYGNLLNKLTGGSYSSIFSDLNKQLKKVMSLAGYGYNLGMCGVFGALTSGMSNDVLSRASGGLLSVMGKAGNTNAVLDIAASSVGLVPLLSNPTAIEGFLGNYKKPSNVKESMLPNLADRTLAGLELIDEHWAVSGYDAGISIAKTAGRTADLKQTFSSKLTNKSFGSSSLDIAASDDMDFMFASYAMS